MSARRTVVKPFRPPKPQGDWPEPPAIDGEPLGPGDEVHHAKHGAGRYLYADWVDLDGKWVDPTARGVKTRRDTSRGQWIAIVSHGDRSSRIPVSELTRRICGA